MIHPLESTGPTTAPVPGASPAVSEPDLFELGRRAAALTRQRHDGKGFFSRCRQLQANGSWKGPRDAADAYVEEADVAAAGGLEAARALGVRTVVVSESVDLARAASAAGLRVLWRLRYAADDAASARRARVEALATLRDGGVLLDGVIPTPIGEPFGLDTLRLFAECRISLPAVPHLVADFVQLGHRLAQMSLGFGADELYGPIMPERALRLGANAHNPVMTRKEAAMLLRGAGLRPHERLSGGALEEHLP